MASRLIIPRLVNCLMNFLALIFSLSFFSFRIKACCFFKFICKDTCLLMLTRVLTIWACMQNWDDCAMLTLNFDISALVFFSSSSMENRSKSHHCKSEFLINIASYSPIRLFCFFRFFLASFSCLRLVLSWSKCDCQALSYTYNCSFLDNPECCLMIFCKRNRISCCSLQPNFMVT